MSLIALIFCCVVAAANANVASLNRKEPTPQDWVNLEKLATLGREYVEIQNTTSHLIQAHGYPFEEHEVQSADGYILTIFRIPGTPTNPSPAGKPVVFVQHGLLSSSADWVVTGPSHGLAYLLADAGYDVWLGNARGNTHGRRHVSMSPNSRGFWDFSWHEIGVFDLPAMIDYTLSRSGAPNLHYIGHSQGTTSFFVMASMRPEYNAKIRSMHALAPVAFMSNLASPFIRVIAPFVDSLEWILSMLGVNEFLPSSALMEMGGYLLCRDTSPFQEICANVLFLIGGFNSDQLNRTIIPAIMQNTPAGASVNQFVHYGQGVNSRRFRQYDHGLIGNLQRYGSATPPDYPIGRITAPVALHFSDNDWLAAVVDVQELASRLPNVIGRFRVPDARFNHLDFLWAIDAHSLLYNRMLNFMIRF